MNSHRLFDEIHKFRKWASIQDNKSAEWECEYGHWTNIHTSFEAFIDNPDYLRWSDFELSEILYIIARDNELEDLSGMVGAKEGLLLFLAKHALDIGESNAKWQLAVQLPNCRQHSAAEKLLILYVQDEDEYVNRRALMALADMQSALTEKYCAIAWKRDCYGEMQEYQRMAVLYALFAIRSNLLPQYISWAKADGRKWLLQNALQIESKLQWKK